MKAKDIKTGGHYTAKISGRLVTVRVNAIRETFRYHCNPYSGLREDRSVTVYDVTNLSTGRKTTFRSAMKFRSVAPTERLPLTGAVVAVKPSPTMEGEYR